MRRFVAIVLMILVITTAGCGQMMSPFAQATPTPNPTATIEPTKTPEPSATPTSTPTIEPTATEIPSPTVDPQVKMDEETIVRMNQFLNSEGNFTDKKLGDVLIHVDYESTNVKNELGLILTGGKPTTNNNYLPMARVQNLLLGYKIDQGNIYYVLGNEDRNGKRFAYTAYITERNCLGDPACLAGGIISVFEGTSSWMISYSILNNVTDKHYQTNDEIKVFLDKMIGRGFTFDFMYGKYEEDDPNNLITQAVWKGIPFACELINRIQRPNRSQSESLSFVAGNGSIGKEGFYYKANPITMDDLNGLTPNENMIYQDGLILAYIGTP
jgi:hypothetical protein